MENTECLSSAKYLSSQRSTQQTSEQLLEAAGKDSELPGRAAGNP